jgi:hypothetical protein
MDRNKPSEKAFKEACKKNDLIYKKHDNGTESESIELLDEEGNRFNLNKDLSVRKCNNDHHDNELAATKDNTIKRSAKKGLKKNSAYKMQKGLQKA